MSEQLEKNINDYNELMIEISLLQAKKDVLTLAIGEELAQLPKDSYYKVMKKPEEYFNFRHAIDIYEKVTRNFQPRNYLVARSADDNGFVLMQTGLPLGMGDQYGRKYIAKFEDEGMAVDFKFHLMSQDLKYSKQRYLSSKIQVEILYKTNLQLITEAARLELNDTDDYSYIDEIHFELNSRVSRMTKYEFDNLFSEIEKDDLLANSSWYKVQKNSH